MCRIFITIIAFCILLSINSCDSDEEELWHYNQYVFLEQHYHEHSELLAGECRLKLLDFPTYEFDPSTGVLTDFGRNVKMKKSLLMVLGAGMSASGDAGGGAGTKLMGIEDLPSKKYSISIDKIDPDGTIYFQYKDSKIVLHADEEWMEISTDTIEDVDDNGDTLGIVKYTYSDKITNWGLLEKEFFAETDLT